MIKSTFILSFLLTAGLFAANTKSGVKNYTATSITSPASNALTLKGTTTVGIQTYNSGWQDRVTVLNTGKIGIGTTTPNVRLETKASAGETDVANFIANDFVVNSTGSVLVIKSIDGNGLNAIDSYKNGGGATQHLSLQRNGGSVGIGLGSGSPVGRLDVKSSGENSVAFSITDNDSASRIFEVDQETGGRGSAYLRDASNNLKIKLDTEGDTYFNGGYVGIGTTSPADYLSVYGNVGTTNLLSLTDSRSYGTGIGGNMVFVGKFNNAGTLANFGMISGIKENATDGDYASAITFKTRANNGSLTEGMRINSSGNVQVASGVMAGGLSGKYLGSFRQNGLEEGNNYMECGLTPPTGTKFVHVYVTGNMYGGSQIHTGYLYSIWSVDSGNRFFTIADVNHSSGSNQGFAVEYAAGTINVRNKTSMANNQSGNCLYVVYGS